MEESGRVDDEGRPILERVDLMEAFFAGVHRQQRAGRERKDDLNNQEVSDVAENGKR